MTGHPLNPILLILLFFWLIVGCGANEDQRFLESYRSEKSNPDVSCQLLIDNGTLKLKVLNLTEPQYTLSFGPGGTVSAWIQDSSGANFIADSFAGESTDRVIQWVLFNEAKNPKFHYGDFSDRFNVNQAGTEDGLLSLIGDIQFDPSSCQLRISSMQQQQWKPLNRDHFAAEFYTEVSYRIYPDLSVHVKWSIEKRKALNLSTLLDIGPDYYLETWSPFRQSLFTKLEISTQQPFSVGSNIPYYPYLKRSQLSGVAQLWQSNGASGIQLVFPSSNFSIKNRAGSLAEIVGSNVLNFIDQSGVIGLLPATVFSSNSSSWGNSEWVIFERIFQPISDITEADKSNKYWNLTLQPLQILDANLVTSTVDRQIVSLEKMSASTVVDRASQAVSNLASGAIIGTTAF